MIANTEAHSWSLAGINVLSLLVVWILLELQIVVTVSVTNLEIGMNVL
jgi:hypothetical protein